MDLRGHFEDRLEANTFLANVSVGVSLGGLAGTTDGFNIAFIKAIFIGVDDDFVCVESEYQERVLVCRCRLGI